jgi:hypothetical protein
MEQPTSARADAHATTTPPPAETARTILEYGGPARLRIAWAPGLADVPYVPDRNGEPWLLLPAERTADWPGRDLSGVLHVEDPAGTGIAASGTSLLAGGRLSRVSPEAQTPIAVELAALRPLGALLDVGHGLALHHLAITDIRLTGTVSAAVDLATYVAARPDPVRPHAAHILSHLAQDHRATLAGILRTHLRARHGWSPADIVPLALDRHGLELAYREKPASQLVRVRVPFHAPIRGMVGLGAALRAITPCACHPTEE